MLRLTFTESKEPETRNEHIATHIFHRKTRRRGQRRDGRHYPYDPGKRFPDPWHANARNQQATGRRFLCRACQPSVFLIHSPHLCPAGRSWFWRWKKITPLPIYASSWAPPIPPTLKKARSAKSGHRALSTMPSTAQTPTTLRALS